MARDQIRGIPLERSALHIGVQVRLGDRNAVTHVVEDRLFRAGAADRSHHAIDVLDRRRIFEMAGLVADLEGEDVGIVLVGETGVGIHMARELREITLLQRPRLAIFETSLLAVLAAETCERHSRLGIGCVSEL